MVMRLPENDRFSMPRDKMEADIAVAMAGRVAEEIIFGKEKVTSGASSDIKMATRMAKAMVTDWGLAIRSVLCTMEVLVKICILIEIVLVIDQKVLQS